MEISHSRVWGEKNLGAQYAGNTPGEAVRIKSKMFDIFGLTRQIPLCVRPSWSTSRNIKIYKCQSTFVAVKALMGTFLLSEP